MLTTHIFVTVKDHLCVQGRIVNVSFAFPFVTTLDFSVCDKVKIKTTRLSDARRDT